MRNDETDFGCARDHRSEVIPTPVRCVFEGVEVVTPGCVTEPSWPSRLRLSSSRTARSAMAPAARWIRRPTPVLGAWVWIGVTTRRRPLQICQRGAISRSRPGSRRSVLPTSRAISSADLEAISYPVTPSHHTATSEGRGRRSGSVQLWCAATRSINCCTRGWTRSWDAASALCTAREFEGAGQVRASEFIFVFIDRIESFTDQVLDAGGSRVGRRGFRLFASHEQPELLSHYPSPLIIFSAHPFAVAAKRTKFV